MQGVMTILKYFVKDLYFKNLKGKIGVIGQQINMGRCGTKRQKSPAKKRRPLC